MESHISHLFLVKPVDDIYVSKVLCFALMRMISLSHVLIIFIIFNFCFFSHVSVCKCNLFGAAFGLLELELIF